MTAGPNGEHVVFDAHELHRRAHATVASYGEDGMWLEPMETALVALADAQHPRGSRQMATEALDGFMQWLTKNEPRALGDDAAALAIAARAARDLQRGSAQLTDPGGGARHHGMRATQPASAAARRLSLMGPGPARHRPERAAVGSHPQRAAWLHPPGSERSPRSLRDDLGRPAALRS